MIHTIVNPGIEKAFSFIEEYHRRKAEKTTLIILGDCMVEYRGRAKSFLDWGERIVMIKQDGTLLIHQPILREPVNWQPSGSKNSFLVKDGNLILNSIHKNPSEKMKIVFRSISGVIVASLRDQAKLLITGMETDVVNHILLNPDCIEEGLRIKKREKPVKSGVIDLFGYDKNHTPVVIEVKRGLANINAVHQLRMYVNDLREGREDVKIRGILCAPRIPDMVKNLLSDYGLEWREISCPMVLPDDWQKTLEDFH